MPMQHEEAEVHVLQMCWLFLIGRSWEGVHCMSVYSKIGQRVRCVGAPHLSCVCMSSMYELGV